MIEPNTSSWKRAGESSNTLYYEIEPGVLAVLPHPGTVDDERAARENVALQNEYFRRRGRPGIVVVFFDRLTGQNKDARRVYQAGLDPAWIAGAALVGGSLLGRAMMSFFLGIARPRIPTCVFGDVPNAVRWARERHAEKDAA